MMPSSLHTEPMNKSIPETEPPEGLTSPNPTEALTPLEQPVLTLEQIEENIRQRKRLREIGQPTFVAG